LKCQKWIQQFNSIIYKFQHYCCDFFKIPASSHIPNGCKHYQVHNSITLYRFRQKWFKTIYQLKILRTKKNHKYLRNTLIHKAKQFMLPKKKSLHILEEGEHLIIYNLLKHDKITLNWCFLEFLLVPSSLGWFQGIYKKSQLQNFQGHESTSKTRNMHYLLSNIFNDKFWRSHLDVLYLNM
jgi:hypothetical protein